MSAGGLMQLIAYGAQDAYLTGSSHITFFQSVYRSHTSFSDRYIQQEQEKEQFMIKNSDKYLNISLDVQIPEIIDPGDCDDYDYNNIDEYEIILIISI